MEKKSIRGWNLTRVWPATYRLAGRSLDRETEKGGNGGRQGGQRGPEKKKEDRLESIVERGQRVRRDDLLSLLQLHAYRVNTRHRVVSRELYDAR